MLPRLTSRAAAETFLTGRTFDAAEAAAMGLVTRAVPADELDAAVAEVCAELLQAHPQGLRETKALLARELVEHIDAHAEEMADPQRTAVRLRRGARGDDRVPDPQEVGQLRPTHGVQPRAAMKASPVPRASSE